MPRSDHRPRWWIGLALIALVGCSSAATTAPRAAGPVTPTPGAAGPTSQPECAWYSAMATPGQVVSVTATGPACRDRSLVGWLTSDSDRPWTSEALIPSSYGTLLAQLARNGTVVRLWYTGPLRGEAAPLAGTLADGLQKAGWRPQVPSS